MKFRALLLCIAIVGIILPQAFLSAPRVYACNEGQPTGGMSADGGGDSAYVDDINTGATMTVPYGTTVEVNANGTTNAGQLSLTGTNSWFTVGSPYNTYPYSSSSSNITGPYVYSSGDSIDAQYGPITQATSVYYYENDDCTGATASGMISIYPGPATSTLQINTSVNGGSISSANAHLCNTTKTGSGLVLNMSGAYVQKVVLCNSSNQSSFSFTIPSSVSGWIYLSGQSLGTNYLGYNGSDYASTVMINGASSYGLNISPGSSNTLNIQITTKSLIKVQ